MLNFVVIVLSIILNTEIALYVMYFAC
jgi:hypothetical protein